MKKTVFAILVLLASSYSQASLTLAPEISNIRTSPCYQAAQAGLEAALKDWHLIGTDKKISVVVTDLNIFAPREGFLLAAKTISTWPNGFTLVAHWTAPVQDYRHYSPTCSVGEMTIAIEDDFLSGGGGVSVHN